MGHLRRLGIHLFRARGAAARCFPPPVLARIDQRISESEAGHGGEIVLAVESRLRLAAAWRGVTPRERALQAFNELEVWDTQGDCGVLLYLLLAERAFEIVADRGVAARVDAAQWNAVCAAATQAFARGEFESGVLAAVDGVDALLRAHFPDTENRSGQLADAPVLR